MTHRTGDERRWDVFISYSRADEPFVHRLYHDLRRGDGQKNVEVWWDREYMESRGRKFVQEFYRAIERSDRLLAVVSRPAVESEYVQAEWEHAELFAKAVVPILRADPAPMPSKLRSLHYVDFQDERLYERALAQLRQIISARIEDLAAFLTAVPALPPHFLLRGAEIAAVESAVLTGVDRLMPHDARARITVLRGLPGAGKTTIAAAFAQCTAARKAFRHVAWVSLGETPDLLDSIRSIGLALGDSELHYASEASAANRLRTMLEERHCLLVLDDACEVSHVTPFSNATDATTRLLVTTRERGLATSLDAAELETSELPPPEALRLLASWAGDLMREDDAADAAAVAEECGHLPLTLAICGALIQEGHTWPDLLMALQNADVRFVDRALPNYKHTNVLRAVDVSVERLRREMPEAAQRFTELVVFAEDAVIPERAIVRFWCRAGNLAEYQARGLLTKIANKELIRVGGVAPNRSVSMHDMVHDYLRAKTGAASHPHEEFLRAHNPANSPWHAVPDDGYIHGHLTYHLERAGRAKDIDGLLREITDDGRNGWYDALERHGATPQYVTDVTRAWRLARESGRGMSADERPACDVAGAIRYALCLSSVKSVYTRVPPALLGMALRYGLRSWAQVKSFADLRSEPIDRARVLAAIVEEAPPKFRADTVRETVTAALAVENWKEKADVLVEVARLEALPDDLVNRMMSAIEADSWTGGADLLAALAPRLTPASYEAALAIARRFPSSKERAKAASALLPGLDDESREYFLHDLIAEKDALPVGVERVQMLCELIPIWPEAADEALLHAEQLVSGEENWTRAALIIVALARSLPDDQLPRVARLLPSAEINDTARTFAISVLGSRVPALVREEATRLYHVLGRMKWDHDRGLAALLAQFISDAPPAAATAESVARIVRLAGMAVGPLDDLNDMKRRAARSLLGKIPDEFIDGAIDAARQIVSDRERADVLSVILRRCPVSQQHQLIVEQALRRVAVIGDDEHRAAAMAALIPHLEHGERRRTAEEALAIGAKAHINRRCELVSALAPYLEPLTVQRVLQELLDSLLSANDPDDAALAALTRHIGSPGLERIAQYADAHPEKAYITRAVLVGRRPSSERARSIEALLAGPSWLPRELPRDFVTVLRETAEFMDEAQLKTASDITDSIQESSRPAAWSVLVPRLSPDAVADVHRKAGALEDPNYRTAALCAVSPYVPGDRDKAIGEAFDKAADFDGVGFRIEALRSLGKYMTVDDLAPVIAGTLQRAEAIVDDRQRAEMLAAFIGISAASLRDRQDAFDKMLESCVGLTATIGSSTRKHLTRPFLLQNIAQSGSSLAEIGGANAVAETVAAIRDTAAWWP